MPSNLYNVSNGEHYSTAQIVDVIKQVVPGADLSVGPGMQPWIDYTVLRGSFDITRIKNDLGLHARAAAKFVTLASSFASDIRVARNGQEVNGKSIMGVMMLAASRGSDITLIAVGDDETDAVSGLAELIAQRFGEEE